jgi:phage recombination protein Bet
MTEAIVPTTQNSVIHRVAERYGVMPLTLKKTLMKTIMPGNITEEQFIAVMMVADTYKLNPLTKEIYAFPGKGGGIVPIVSIDGWTRICNDHPQFDGVEFENITEDGRLQGITAIIYRKDRSMPTKVTEWMEECAGKTEPWKRWPARMLRHKAFIQCARLAFGFAGIYDPDEASRIVSVVDIPADQADGPAKTGVEALAEAAGLDVTPEPPVEEIAVEEPAAPSEPVDMEPTQEAMDFFGEGEAK